MECAYAAFTSSQDSKQGVILADETDGKLRAQSHFTADLDHLALPLRFACSHLGVGRPHACTDKGVRAKLPFRARFFRGALQTWGYEIFSRMPTEPTATATKYKYFSVH